jgi:putative oxidoreductase
MATQVLTTTSPSTAKAKNAVLWIFQILGAVMFFMAGYKKLTGDPMMIGLFDTIGVGQWFRYVTGTIEFGSAILLLTPWFAGVGAILLVCTMIGAILTHLFIIGGNPTMPIVLLVLMAVVAYGRKERTFRVLTSTRLLNNTTRTNRK